MAESAIESISSDEREVLLFTVDERDYGIDIDCVDEIIPWERVTPIPKMPDYIKGVINIRGRIVPVISVRLRFGKEDISPDERTCIIIIEAGGERVGAIVDRVREVIRVKPADKCPSPAAKGVNRGRFIKNIILTAAGKKLLIDCDALISGQD